MCRLNQKFSRKNFEECVESETLARALTTELTSRLEHAGDRLQEAAEIVADLRALGHDLFLWDESHDWQQWGDDYMRPRALRFILQLEFDADLPPTVNVDFGPWPLPTAPTLCPNCKTEMHGTNIRVRGIGHGHTASLPVQVELQLGETESRSFAVGHRSQSLQIQASSCPGCKGLWIPNPSQIGWTG